MSEKNMPEPTDPKKRELLRKSFLRKSKQVRDSNIIACIFATEKTKDFFLNDPKGFLETISVKPSTINIKALIKVVEDLGIKALTLDLQGIQVMNKECNFEEKSETHASKGFTPDMFTFEKSNTNRGCSQDWSNKTKGIDLSEISEIWADSDLLPLIDTKMLNKLE
jgi:hypothetical protein